MKIERVLAVCSGNTCRSPMAAALLRHLWQQAGAPWELQVESAGTGAFPGLGASDHAVAVLRERGVDLSTHRSQPVSDEVLSRADLVLTMTRNHKDFILALWPNLSGRVFTMGEYAETGKDISDPFGGPLAAYQETAAQLTKLLQTIVVRIRREGKPDQ